MDLAKFETSAASVVDDLIGSNAADLLSRKFTLASGQNVVRGTVMGVVTSGGKLKKAASGAGDGSETPDSIAAVDADASDGDVDVLCYVRGSFNENALTLGSGLTVAGIRAALRDKGIFLETPVKRPT